MILSMKEQAIQRKIIKHLEGMANVWLCKTIASNKRGVPDILACINGRFVGFEVKAETGRPSKLQEYQISKIRAAGGIAYVVKSVEDVDHVLHISGFKRG